MSYWWRWQEPVLSLIHILVVDMILYFAGFPGERLKVRTHQFDVNGIVVLPSDGELISGLCAVS